MAWVDNNEYPPLTNDWADVQEKVFTRWLNTHLKRREPPIELKMGSLYRGALCSGIILWELIDQIAEDKPSKKVDRRGKMRIHYINNINISIDFLTAGHPPDRKPLKFVNVGAEDILDKRPVVAGFIWTIILRFQVSDCSIDHFIQWLNSVGIMVKNLTSDWQDGQQLAKLVNILRPDYVKVQGDPLDTVEGALLVSEDEFAIPRIIDAGDMVLHPEERSNFVYLSYFKQLWDDLQGASCRLIGEPKRTVRTRKPCCIELKTWDVKNIENDVKATFIIHTGEEFPLKVERIDRPDCADGRTGYATFTLIPPRPGIYTSSIKVGDREMRKGPIVVNATPAPSAKILSVPQGKQGIPTVIALSTENGLTTDDLYVELVDNHGKATRVPAIFSEDGLNHQQFNCVFVPPTSGNMTLRILYKEDGQEVEGSGAAFTVFGKPSIDWDSADVPDRFLVGVTSSVILHAVGHEADALDVTLKDSDGNYLPVNLEDRNDGTFVVSFTPETEGLHRFDIKTDLVSVEGLPRDIRVEAKPSASFTGPRELLGVAMKPVTFDLATVNLKPSEVKLAISDNKGNPVDLPVTVKDNGNGTFSVSFTPTKVGALDVNVEVFGSDLGNLSVNVAPPPVIVGGVDEHRHARATKLFQFQLDAANIAAEDIRVDVKNEKGAAALAHPPSVREGTPNFVVSFVPPDPGMLKVTVWPAYPDALPLTVNVLPIAKFIGETHHVVVATKPFSFKVQGAEGISLDDIAVFVYDKEGKKVAQAKVSDNKDGTYTAGFTPEEPGDFEVRISTCGDFLDTPLSLKVRPCLSLAYGESSVRKAAAGRPFSFDVQGQKGLKAKHISVNIGSEKGSHIDPPTVKENPDGSFTVTFVPPKPDMLAVDVLAHGTSATKLDVEVLPTCHLDSNLTHLKGYASKPVEFTLKADAGLKPSDVAIEAKDKDGHAVPFAVTDNGDGTFKASFTPKHDGEHSVLVSAHGLPIGPPLSADILPLAQFPEGLLSQKHKAIATKPFSFDINAEGLEAKDIQVEIVHDSGAQLPPPTLEKKGNGVFKATFIPDQHGELKIGLSTKGVAFDKKLQVEVAPIARFHGDPKRSTTATKLFEFTLDAPGLSADDVRVNVEGKQGGALPQPKVTDNGNGTLNVAFTPMACDTLAVDIFTKGVKFDTPLEVAVAPIASFIGDTKRIATATKPFSFNLSAKNGLKPSDVLVDVVDSHGKNIGAPTIKDNGNETFTVTFTPMEPGELKVAVATKGVLFDTPLEVYVRPTAKFLGGGRRQATATKPFDFSLGADQLKLSDVKVIIKDEHGKQLDNPSITDSGDGTFNVSFTPMEHGLLSVEVLAHGEAIGSPMEVEVAPIARFLGDLERTGHSTKPFHFTLDAPALSPDNIHVAITNDQGYPLSLDTAVTDNGDGTFDVCFTPMNPSLLVVEVSTKGEKFDTPLKVKVLPTAKWVSPTSLPARATIPVNLKMKAEEGLNPEDIAVDLRYNTGEVVEHTLTDNKDGTYTLSFTPPTEGELSVGVSAHGDPIGESTRVVVAPPPFASLPDGPPLRDATQNKPFTFKLDTVSLLPNEVKVMMGDEEVDVQVKDMRDGTFDVTLVPTKVGDFPIKVSFQGKPAAGKPFSIQVAPQPDVLGFSELKGARVAKPFVIGLKTINLKPELVEVLLHDSEGKPITNFKLSPAGDDSLDISFVPKIPGDHTFNLVVDGHEAEAKGLPATFNVDPKPHATLVGDKKRKGVEGKVFEFKMDTINLRPEDIRLEITDSKGEKIWREDALAGAVTPTSSATSTTSSTSLGRVTSTSNRNSKKPKKGKEEDQTDSLSAPNNRRSPRNASPRSGASPRGDHEAINTPALKGIKVPGDIVIPPPEISKKGDTFRCTFIPWKPGKFEVRVTFEDVIVDLQVTAEPKPKTKTVEILEQLGLNAGFRNIGDEKELLKRIKEKREELVAGYTRNSGLSDTYKEREKTISLLVRNQTSIVAINRAKKRTQRGRGAAEKNASEAATFHRNRKKMALYGNLFYLLRTEPHYLSRLITLANSKELNSHIIRTLFSNAYTPIQQTMLLKLIATSLSYHVKTTTSFEDYKKESASVNLFILFVKETKEGREFMKRHFQKPVMGLLEQPLFTIENADLYKTWAETFYQTIINAIDDLPYGIRYVCSVIYHELQARYPDIEQTALLSAVGWVISYRFINLVNIADWGLIEMGQSDEHQFVSNAASIMKVLNSLFLDLKGLPSTNPHCKTFDKWITSQLPTVKTFLKEVIDVPSPEEHYKVSNYSYLGEGEAIAIPLREIVLMHNECEKNRDELVNKEDPAKDQLSILLDELGDVPADGHSDKTQISLPLQANSKFELQLSAVERVSNLKLETINELLYLFSEYPNVNGETLLEMFLLVKHQATTAATPKPKDAAKVDLILSNLAELAKEDGALKKSNGYNDFIEDIRTELLAKEKHISELRYELRQLSDAITELDEQKKNLSEAIKAYDDYLKSISDELQRNFKTTMKKFTWKQLTDKKCNIIAGTTLTQAQQKGCKFEITHVSAEEFKVKGKVLMYSQEFQIKMSDLLDAKDSGELAYDTGQGVVLDVAATLVFLNAKFFNKKRKYVSAK